MARGTVQLFNQYLHDLGDEVHDMAADEFKVAMYDNTLPWTADTASPAYTATNEVSGNNYTAGGAVVGTTTWTRAVADTTLAGDDVGWTMIAGGPTDCYQGLVYNNTAAGKEAVGFVDLDGPVSLEADDIDIEWTDGELFVFSANTPAP